VDNDDIQVHVDDDSLTPYINSVDNSKVGPDWLPEESTAVPVKSLLDEQVHSNLICMHCAQPLEQQRVLDVLEVSHPPIVDNAVTENPWTCYITPGLTAQEALVEIGKMVRLVHEFDTPEGHTTITPNMSDMPGNMRALPGPKSPSYTDIHPTNHQSWALRQILAPHIESIGALLHLIPILQEMQQWTFSVSDDCGLDASIILRVTQRGCQYDQSGTERGRRDSSPDSTRKNHDHAHQGVPDNTDVGNVGNAPKTPTAAEHDTE
jgi:hypothetical protein